MNADAFRQLYDYHFAENRKLRDLTDGLSAEQFTQSAGYSHGSVRNQIVHLLDADDVWFSELRGVAPLDPLPAAADDRAPIHTHWDAVELRMREYLGALQDEMLFTRPIREPEEDRHLFVWQVLLHVVNHGTDHRAQLLRHLNDLGVVTESQDFIFHLYADQ
ncbi:MAG TPA: DinB family protein [Roseiflexaceae bacterium]|nr:DinB family protein [Roseiflexaceae bacterium]